MANVTPVRGTQSFVGVMAEVFRRPSLTGLEVLWRWVFWVAVLAGRPARALYAAAMQVVAAFQAGGFPALGQVLVSLAAATTAWAKNSTGLLLLVLGLWLVVAAVGRRFVLRRAGKGSVAGTFPMLILTAIRWTTWAAVVALWCAGLRWAVGAFVGGPQRRGAEPSWVPLCAVLIAGTLVLFVLWLGTAWVFPLVEIYASRGTPVGLSLRDALRRGPVTGKLAEINLVMGIVKIALLVLAMVFSACPLPFETVETQSFLMTWTAGVLLLYFVASDYFHVVRLVAFLRMTEVLAPLPLGAAAIGSEGAS